MAGLLCPKEKKADDTLLDFGYKFDKDGKMKNVRTGEAFQFVVREGDQSYNQQHYETLGEVVTEEVYRLLEKECKLKRVPIPHDAEKDEPSTFIFVSEDAMTNPEKILILIHGSGVVRAGQWARRLIINDSLDSGTQIPFIKKAQEKGYGIVVMNTNDNYNYRVSGGKRFKSRIRDAENPEQHALHVWQHYIKAAKAKHIAIIAHSYGGCVTTALFQHKKKEFKKQVFAVAMTDSVHFLPSSDAFTELVKISCNWVCSQKPLDTPVGTHSRDIKRVSSGVTVHEMTSWASFQSIFKFLDKRLNAVKRGGDPGESTTDNAVESTTDNAGESTTDNAGESTTDKAGEEENDAPVMNNSSQDGQADGASKSSGGHGDAPANGKRHEHPARRYGGHDMSDDEECKAHGKKKKLTR